MPPSERSESRDGEPAGQDSSSEIPMWDSSDPKRAPPPLPLNPGTPNASPTKHSTSATIAAAAAALVERAREGMNGPSPYTVNSMADRSLDRPSPTKTPQHRRLQSLQTGSARDIRATLEASSERNSISRPSSAFSIREIRDPIRTPEQSPTRSGSATPTQQSKDGSAARLVRPPPRPILGENTPPSSTMLAIQNMQIKDDDLPLGDVSNSSTPRNLRIQNTESMHSQIVNLTAIATALQKEMAALSRRSKDNATDLISLKEATSTRDEDIRKSLRELVSTVKASEAGLLGPPPRIDAPRSASAFGYSHFIDSQPYNSPPFSKSLSLPGISKPHPFPIGLDHDRAESPLPFSVEGAASVAMLEKVIREMATKETQERLLSQFSEVLDNATKVPSSSSTKEDQEQFISQLTDVLEKSGKASAETAKETTKKVEELFEYIRTKPVDQPVQSSQALVKHYGMAREVGQDAPQLDVNFNDLNGGVSVRNGQSLASKTGPLVAHMPSEESQKLLQRIKDSVAQAGGMTAEVKSILKDLRGEVLYMGRDIASKMDSSASSSKNAAITAEDKEELFSIVQDGLTELKNHMDEVIRTRRRQSSISEEARNNMDSEEVYAVVKHALAERDLTKSQNLQPVQPQFDQDAIIEAVKEAYEAYKPEIQIEQNGLERDEILDCLKEGFRDYQAAHSQNDLKQETIYDIVNAAIQNFNPPQLFELKEEILGSVKNCLEDFGATIQHTNAERRPSISRDDVLDAVREGLGNFKQDGAREIEINRVDLFEAVQAGLDNSRKPFGEYGDQVLNSLHEIVDSMRNEFKQYSAANGGDTEMVLDAMKDGLESLRAQIMSYVDRAQDVTGKDEIIDNLQVLRRTVEDFTASSNQSGSVTDAARLVEYIKAEFEHLRSSLPEDSNEESAMKSKDEILFALSAGFEELKANGVNRGSDDLNDEVLEAMKAEFDQLCQTILNGSASNKDEITETLQEILARLPNQQQLVEDGSGINANADLLSAMREDLFALRESLDLENLRVQHLEDKEDVIKAVKESLENIRVQLAADQNDAAGETLGMMKEELEQLRLSLGSALAPTTTVSEKEEILETIRLALNQFHIQEREDTRSVHEGALESVKEELEHLRQSLAGTLLQTNGRADTDEILETVRLGLDDLRSHIDHTVIVPEQSSSGQTEILDALNDNLDNLRIDIAKIMDKPLDMTMSHEILEAVKDGLASIKQDISQLKPETEQARNDEVILAEPVAGPVSRDFADSHEHNPLKKDDIEKVEVMLAHLQIKVEAMDQNMQNTPTPAPASEPEPRETAAESHKEELGKIEDLLRDIQASITVMADQSFRPSNSGSTKEDTDAIETLLLNTKAKIDETIIPALEIAVTKDHLDAVEAVIRITNDSIETLSARVAGDAATKDDVAALAHLLDEATTSFNSFKTSTEDERVTKSDIDVVGIVCTDIRSKIENLSESDTMPSKADIEQLKDMLQELRDGHDGLKDQHERDIEITAKAFDDRKDEASTILEHIADLKNYVEESKDELKYRMKKGSQDVRAIDEILQGIEEKIDASPNAITDVQELAEVVKSEFLRAQELMEAMKVDHEESAATTFKAQEEHRDAIIADLKEKFDDRFDHIMLSTEEVKTATELAITELTTRFGEQDDLLSGSRAMAEELKVTIDTLGATIQNISPALEEATGKMSEDSQTVFNKLEDVHTKLDDHHIDNKTEHQFTRDEIVKCLLATGNLHEQVEAFQPQTLDTLRTIVSLVQEHYNHSKQFQETSQENHKLAINRAEELQTNFASMSKYEAPMLPAPGLDKEDEFKINNKLDELLRHATTPTPEKSIPQLDRIDEIHQQVIASAAEISAFVEFQKKLLSVDHDNKEREANQAALDLSKCLSEKDDLDASIEDLRDVKAKLLADVESLRTDRDDLTSQKMRLTGEVSSIETALTIRREELQMMDVRADALERRIIEGVMDHSRALLIAKAPKKQVNMNLKRVASNASTATTIPSSTTGAGVGMALKSKVTARKNTANANANPMARRILSLSQINDNVAAGGNRALVSVARNPVGGLTNLKRSQSVKNPAARKKSWAGPGSLAGYDKENNELSEESESEQGNYADQSRNPTALSGSYMDTHSAVSANTDRRTSHGTAPSEYTYGTGSYFTDSEVGTRASYGSTIRSNLGINSSLDDSIHEDEEGSGSIDIHPEQDAEEEGLEDNDETPRANEEQTSENHIQSLEQAHEQIEGKPNPSQMGLVLRTDGYDSGLGSDIHTATLSGLNGQEGYFKSLNDI